MNYETIELEDLSGRNCTIYSVIEQDDEYSSFDHFVMNNDPDYPIEVESIVLRLKQIGAHFGARESFFKTDEGLPGDGVCALYDEDESSLRLYCIRFGSVAIVLGGGGPKSKSIRAWQEDPLLTVEAEKIIEVSKNIIDRIKEKEIFWTDGRTKLGGNLKFNDDDE